MTTRTPPAVAATPRAPRARGRARGRDRRAASRRPSTPRCFDRVGPRMERAMRDDRLRLALQLVLGSARPTRRAARRAGGSSRRRGSCPAPLRPGAVAAVFTVSPNAAYSTRSPAPRAPTTTGPVVTPTRTPKPGDPPAALDVGSVRADGLDDREPGEERTLGVVLGRDRRTEEGEHAVAGKILHVAAEPLDLGDDARDGIGRRRASPRRRRAALRAWSSRRGRRRAR